MLTVFPSSFEITILFVLIVVSIFWLLDSNFSILLNFVLLYILVGLFTIMLGYEFLGISLLLIYSSGIAIIFIITSMIVGSKHISVLSKQDDKNFNFKNIVDYRSEEIGFIALYILFFISIMFTFNFTKSFEDTIYNILVQSSFSGLLTTSTLTSLNDTFVLGLLIYNEYPTHTIVGGFILLISLIASIYISQSK